MCIVSAIGDQWREGFPDRYPHIPYQTNTGSFTFTPAVEVSKEEFDALRKEVEELRDLLIVAKEFDRVTGQPDCEVDEKVAFIRRIAELVGVDIDAVFEPPEGDGDVAYRAPMTVGDLRAALEGLSNDLPVILSSDEEGNHFNRLWNVEHSKYFDDEYGDCCPVHPDDVQAYEDPGYLSDAVVLWP